MLKETDVWTIVGEKCALCGYSKRNFYCKSCVNTGNFCYSVHLYHRPLKAISESSLETPYNIKHKNWLELKKENDEILMRLNHFHRLKSEHSKKEYLIKLKRESIKLLKEKLKREELTFEKVSSEYDVLKEENQKTYKSTALIKAKIANINEHTLRLNNKLRSAEKESTGATRKLSRCRRNLVGEIIRDIFPILSSNANSESVDSMVNSMHKMVSLLRDASRTAFIQGRWVYADSGWDQMYQVLTATLPGNGDYSNCWTAGSINETVRSPGELQASPVLNITAGLSFLNQMVQALSFILDIKLPFHVPLKEFYRLDLTEELFNRAVSRLNKNVATICFYQNVDRKKLHGLHTVVNILSLINTPNLGCDEPQSIKDSRTGDRGGFIPVGDSIFACYEDDFEDENDDDDGDGGEKKSEKVPQRASSDKEWEYVPSGIPNFADSSGEQQSYFASAVATTSVATSIVTSLWKAFGRSGDK